MNFYTRWLSISSFYPQNLSLPLLISLAHGLLLFRLHLNLLQSEPFQSVPTNINGVMLKGNKTCKSANNHSKKRSFNNSESNWDAEGTHHQVVFRRTSALLTDSNEVLNEKWTYLCRDLGCLGFFNHTSIDRDIKPSMSVVGRDTKT